MHWAQILPLVIGPGLDPTLQKNWPLCIHQDGMSSPVESFPFNALGLVNYVYRSPGCKPMELFWCFIILLFLESLPCGRFMHYAPLVGVLSVTLRVINGPKGILSTNNISAAQKANANYQYSLFAPSRFDGEEWSLYNGGDRLTEFPKLTQWILIPNT